MNFKGSQRGKAQWALRATRRRVSSYYHHLQTGNATFKLGISFCSFLKFLSEFIHLTIQIFIHLVRHHLVRQDYASFLASSSFYMNPRIDIQTHIQGLNMMNAYGSPLYYLEST